MKKYFTEEGLERMKKELEYLKKDKRREISRRIKEAASFGDLSENAAYTEAKEEQAFLEGKIMDLENKIREGEVIEKGETGKAEIGSTVVLLDGDKEEGYTLVDSAESDPLDNKISFSSPLGKELLGKRAGDSVTLFFEDEKTNYIIKEIK